MILAITDSISGGRQIITRLLIVDDFEPWRRFIRIVLEPHSEFEVVAEAGNGLEALWQAKNLQPEMILIDIDLPGLDGLEAARRIRSLSRQSKILFVSEDDSIETAQKAFDAGAMGYVIKSDAGAELLIALNNIIAGRRYISKRLARHKFRDGG